MEITMSTIGTHKKQEQEQKEVIANSDEIACGTPDIDVTSNDLEEKETETCPSNNVDQQVQAAKRRIYEQWRI